jgi:hypothetical protein
MAVFSTVAYNPDDKFEKRKRLAWSIACDSSVVTKEDPVLIYDRMMAKFKELDKGNYSILNESNKS